MGNLRKIGIIILAGIVYLITSAILGYISGLILPVNYAALGGMRQYNDPIMLGFFFYGFVAAITAVVLYSLMRLKGALLHKGLFLGLLLWFIFGVTSGYVVFVTMDYPAGFYLNNIAFGLCNWLIMGFIVAKLSENK